MIIWTIIFVILNLFISYIQIHDDFNGTPEVIISCLGYGFMAFKIFRVVFM